MKIPATLRNQGGGVRDGASWRLAVGRLVTRRRLVRLHRELP